MTDKTFCWTMGILFFGLIFSPGVQGLVKKGRSVFDFRLQQSHHHSNRSSHET